ncbi:Nuclear pore complex protein [Quillaja saponaria]|uniref:Nuclear pore complex protein n=1 Tax=Quillaja saponaria TaxID=32244 RepID=A0AAD7Q4B1_QUISA|nr:Nuclear pore complex protein [Quillaja saponaria]
MNFSVLFGFLLVVIMVEHTTSYSGSGPHIADVNILLPPKMTHPVEYRLQGSDGCFKWSWDHHDILAVVPEYNLSSQCSTSARLRSIAPYSGRKETAVYATDVHTGAGIRCKVFVDNVSRIKIFHNSVKLDLDGLATLRVRAFDSKENVFSSLVGLQFMWQLAPANGSPHHIVNVPLKESPLSDCGGLCGDLDIQITLEDSGVFSDLYAVKGIEIGHEIVSVHLLEPQFEHMADEIVLTVAEAMSLDPPSPLFVLVGAVVPYTLKVIRGNAPQVVTLPSSHHLWSVSNSSVAQVDSKLGLAYAMSLGMTAIVVEDTRVAGHIQMSSLNVVLPGFLSLYITPLSISGDPVEGVPSISAMPRWYIVATRQYLIQMKVSAQGPVLEDIYITESEDVKVYDQSEYWETFLVPNHIALKHGWRNSRILKAYASGLGKLTASLTYSGGLHETKEVLKVEQEITVCDQVKFSLAKEKDGSQIILLPWAPAVYQEVELKAVGGCTKASSDYKWLSSDSSTVSVSAFGVVQARKPGKATLKVISIYDSSNYDEVMVEVSTPTSMAMLHSFPVETVVGSHLQAAVTMKASNGANFYRCDAFKSFINWKAGSESFVIVNASREMSFLGSIDNTVLHASSFGPPCSWTSVYASGPGLTMLHASMSKEYQPFDHSFHGLVVLKSSLRIAAYPPLVVCQAGDGSPFGGYWYDLSQAEVDKQLENLEIVYLVPGAHLDVSLLGGPELWDQTVDFIESVDMLDETQANNDGVLVHRVSGGSRSLYRLLCQTLGTFKLVFKRGNWVGDDHPPPAIAEALVSVICSIPSSIVLIADEPVNKHDVIWAAIQASRGSGRLRDTPVTVANERTIRISAVGISDSGEAFANSSALCLRWELSSCEGLLYWHEAYNTVKSITWERFLVLRNESGQCIVHATVTGFVKTLGDSYSGHFPETDNVLTDAIRLQLVSTLTVNPEFNLLYFNPAAKVNLSITGGSCFLEALTNDSRVVEVIQPPSLQCLQLVVTPKGLGTALVTIYDVGLVPPLTASAVVQVANVEWIKILSREEISLMEGRLQTLDLIVGINDGSAFDSSQYVYMNILVHIEDHIVDLVDDDNVSSLAGRYVNAPSFTIKARSLGITTLYVSALQNSGHEIQSLPIKVEVYAPPTIHPHEIFLVPGASYLLTMKGCPSIGVYVEYACLDDKIANIHKYSGRLSAMSAGNTTIIATVFGNEGSAICHAYGSIKVGVPATAILHMQSEQLGVGREMSIYPLFPEGNLFSFYELCKSYQWTVEDEKVLSFKVAEHVKGEKLMTQSATSKETQFDGYLDERELGFVNVLYGRSAGRTNVAVSFSCDFTTSGLKTQSRFYTASVSLFVVPDLPLALGVPITWILPPHYTTKSLLPSSSESHAQSDSQSRKGTIAYSLLRNCGEKNEILHKDAIGIDGDRIKTTESNNMACIQAKDRTTGRTSIASCVMVAEVAQIRITSKEYPVHVIDLAVGAELNLPTSYLDALGNPFYEAYNAVLVYADTNYPDVICINNTSDGKGNVLLKAIRHGKALLRVSISGAPQKSDYMLIRVGAHVHPQNPVLQIGNVLNISVKGLNDKVPGHWFASNESVISVDVLSGLTKAVGEGSAQGISNCPSLKLQTTVTVLKGDSVSVDAPRETLTNIPYPIKGYNFSVKFSDNFGALGNSKGVSYECMVDPPFVGYAKPWVDLDTGNSYCLFFPYSPEHLVHSVPKLEGMRPDISLSINAFLRNANHVSGSASAVFIGGFSILDMGKTSIGLNLTPNSNMTTITILGNTDVDIHWHEHDSMVIRPIKKEVFGMGGRAQYEVRVLGSKRFRDKIIITLPANGQRVEIDVIYEHVERALSGTPKNITFWASILGCLLLFIFMTAIFIWYLDSPSRSQQLNASTRASIAAPATPDRSSPAVLNELSPRTPQPFVEYLSRTIDETPHYKREGRRRINPQNTF